MEFPGHVRNGVVVLDGNPPLPEEAAMVVPYPGAIAGHAAGKTRIQVPLVRTGQPGSGNRTGKCVAEILDAEDVANLRQ